MDASGIEVGIEKHGQGARPRSGRSRELEAAEAALTEPDTRRSAQDRDAPGESRFMADEHRPPGARVLPERLRESLPAARRPEAPVDDQSSTQALVQENPHRVDGSLAGGT